MDNPYPICENCIFVDEPLDKDPCQECNRAFLAQRIKPNFVSKRKPHTNADRIRNMTDEEIEAWYWTMHEQMMWYTDSHLFIHDWLRQEAED
jgi:hypothetical protein